MYRLKVIEVSVDGAAAEAGVETGDYLESYNGFDLPTTDALQKVIANHPHGHHVLAVIRGNKLIKFPCKGGRLGVVVETTDLDTTLYERIIDGGTPQDLEASIAADEERRKKLGSIILSTTSHIDDHKFEVIDIVSSECAYGMNIFKDIFASVRDFVGGRSGAVQGTLKDAKNMCLTELRQAAYDLHADAVIGVKMDYSEFSGKGNAMLFLVATGTAVKLQKTRE